MIDTFFGLAVFASIERLRNVLLNVKLFLLLDRTYTAALSFLFLSRGDPDYL